MGTVRYCFSSEASDSSSSSGTGTSSGSSGEASVHSGAPEESSERSQGVPSSTPPANWCITQGQREAAAQSSA